MNIPDSSNDHETLENPREAFENYIAEYMAIIQPTHLNQTKEQLERACIEHHLNTPAAVASLVIHGLMSEKPYPFQMLKPRIEKAIHDLNRLFIILAIIEKKLKLNTGELDVYVNITGGIKINDPALDIAVVKAVISSIKNEIVPKTSIYFGEVGLTGEIRKVFLEDKRIKEAKRLGFENIYSNKNTKQVS